MKFMGSKKYMLANGLGSLLKEHDGQFQKIYDPFCGSSAVSRFLAENTSNQIVAGDLQKFSVDLANSILLRNLPMSANELNMLDSWFEVSQGFHEIISRSQDVKKTKKFVFENRKLSANCSYPITSAYGGFYFSYDQALKIDALLFFLPDQEPIRSIALSSLIEAASHCAASPGHTAQPFNPSGKGLISIVQSWKKDPFKYVRSAILDLSTRHAKSIGFARVSDANTSINSLTENDMVFLDPPYSRVHYSRFYHVLETISRNSFEKVTGSGRYPIQKNRPISAFSIPGQSQNALKDLFSTIAAKRATCILTFPSDNCSNGLSGKLVQRIAKTYFTVKTENVTGKFSTLGGNNENRPARTASRELIFVLAPK